ncbi:MAG: FCD domain-containing protein [Geminicoccaceae bacterium]
MLALTTAALRDEDARRYSRYDGEFHQTLFNLAANPFLAAAHQAVPAEIAAVRHRPFSPWVDPRPRPAPLPTTHRWYPWGGWEGERAGAS